MTGGSLINEAAEVMVVLGICGTAAWEALHGQWLFLVPLKGGRWHIVPQLAVYTTYTTYILPSGGLYATYHLLGEPETTIDMAGNQRAIQANMETTS